jgi:Cys-tRNA(Pro)/Cys-tRNA(Cys) deacylase
MSTRAIQYLKQRKVSFEVVQYEHLQKGAEFAAQATGFPLDRTVKTLVVDLGSGRHGLVLVPGDRKADMKRVARAFETKRAEMVDAATAERLTGYHVGGISPFGVRQALPVLMDAIVLSHEKILINAGQRGTMLKMSPADIRSGLVGCLVADVSEG